jgi:DNA-binding transcriptional ArsR family regulator
LPPWLPQTLQLDCAAFDENQYIDKHIVIRQTELRWIKDMKREDMVENAAIDLDVMRQGAQGACALMKVLANPDRLLLLCQIADGERNVGELEEALGIGQPTLSQQLTVLRSESLVATRRDGKNIYYRLASPRAMAIMQALYAQFCASAKPKRSRQ